MRPLEINLQIVSYGEPSDGLNNAKSAVRTQRLPPPLLRSYASGHTKEALGTSRNSLSIKLVMSGETRSIYHWKIEIKREVFCTSCLQVLYWINLGVLAVLVRLKRFL